MSHQSPNPFKWRHFQSDIILLCVRWYLRYALSYRDLEEMMAERGLSVDHTTISIVGCSAMRQNLRNVVDRTSKLATTPGEWMRPTSKSEKPGSISTEP